MKLLIRNRTDVIYRRRSDCGGFLSRALVRKNFPILDTHLHAAQDEVVARACFNHGLIELGKELLLGPRRVSYWSVSDLIAAQYVQSGDPVKAESAARALDDILAYTEEVMAVTSRAILSYNTARLWLIAGNEDFALAGLKKALAKSNRFVIKRIKSHPEVTKFLLAHQQELDPALISRVLSDPLK